MRILVVDDMISMRHVIIHMLRDLEFTDIDEAVDGQQALDMLKSKPFDLVITDFHMPNLNGQQLLVKIRSEKKLAKLPVLMVSCEGDKEKIKSLVQCKVTGFIVKPFNTLTLKKQLEMIKAKYYSPIVIQ